MGLTLGEVEIGELFHQPQDAAEGTRRLAPGLAGGPQPGYVEMSVSHGDDVYRQGWPCRCQPLVEGLLCCRDALVEAVLDRLVLSAVAGLTDV